MRNKFVVILIVSLQVLILTGMIVKAMMPLVTGKEIRLKVVPVDPRDLFRGNYVALRYSFNNLQMDSIQTDITEARELKLGDIFYLQMEEKDGYYEPVGLWTSMPDDEHIYMQAYVNSKYNHWDWLNLKCGIESYYTDPATAKAIEDALPRWRDNITMDVTVNVMVATNGEARIKSIDYGR